MEYKLLEPYHAGQAAEIHIEGQPGFTSKASRTPYLPNWASRF